MEATHALKTPSLSPVSLKRVFPILSVVGIVVIFHILSEESFLTPRNLSNLSRQVCVNLTLAMGMTLVILTSGIDLSVGSVMALAGMVAALTQVSGALGDWGVMGALLSSIFAILIGGLCGALTGWLVGSVHITPFIVSLGMMVIARGVTLIISGAQAVAPVSVEFGWLSSDYLPPTPSFMVLLASQVLFLIWKILGVVQKQVTLKKSLMDASYILVLGLSMMFIFCSYRGIPYMVFVAAAVTLGGWYVLKYLRFGRFIFAIGGNREAAILSGVPVENTLFFTYFLMGILSGVAGVMDVSRVNGAVPSAGELAELDAIAAVVIGGTSLMGGLGSVGGTLFGVLVMGILNNGLSLMGVSDHYQKVFKGVVIVLAVYLDLKSKKKV